MSLVTPLEPGPGNAGRQADRPPLQVSLWSGLSVAVASAPGRGHAVNEDAHSALVRHARVFVVADGVGGGAMAAFASRELVGRLHAMLDRRRISAASVCQALLAADRWIAQRIAQSTDAPGAATVALCAPVNVLASRWLVAWVGDCRVYRLQPQAEARALTRDDSFEQLCELPPPGSSPDDPARMVGNGAVLQPNVAFAELERGELLLMCSDGVHKHVDAAELGRLPVARQPLAQRCEELIARARANGSTDDATVMLLRRGRSAEPVPRPAGAHTNDNGIIE